MKITAQFTGVISTGEFENERPLFALEEEFNGTDIEIQMRQQELAEMVRTMFDKMQKESIIKRIEKLKEGLRFYPPENYPSVTSIIGWKDSYNIPPDELAQYAARGTIIHKLAEIYAKTKKWENPEDVKELNGDWIIFSKGSLRLSLDGYDVPGFLEKYPMEFIKTEFIVKNHQFKYAGKPDGKTIYDKKKTLIDYKTGEIDEIKCFKQLTFYWHCPENKDVEQVMVIPLRPTSKVKQGYSKPLILDDKDKYWDLCLEDRENFKKRFGI